MSSGRLYWENTLGFFDIKDVKVPAAVSVFPRELYQAPRSWTEAAYPNLIYFNELDRGNHFAAWQEPELFTRAARRVPLAPLAHPLQPSAGRTRPEGYRSPMFRMAVGHSDDVDLASAMEAVFAQCDAGLAGARAEGRAPDERLGDRPPVRDRPGARPLPGDRARRLEQRRRDVLRPGVPRGLRGPRACSRRTRSTSWSGWGAISRPTASRPPTRPSRRPRPRRGSRHGCASCCRRSAASRRA